MDQNSVPQAEPDAPSKSTDRLGLINQDWFQILAVGIILIGALLAVYHITLITKLIPALLLFSAALGPLTFIAFLISRAPQIANSVPLKTLLIVFVIGGAIGLCVGGLGDWEFIGTGSTWQIILVGFIEEPAKLVVPLILFHWSSWRSRAAGIMIGVASAAGFAIFESMGYGFDSFITASPDEQFFVGVDQSVLTNLFRSITTPFGHLAWTGYVAGSLWGARQTSGKTSLSAGLGAFITVALLHSGFDTSLYAMPLTYGVSLIVFLAISGLSYKLVMKQVRFAALNSLGSETAKSIDLAE